MQLSPQLTKLAKGTASAIAKGISARMRNRGVPADEVSSDEKQLTQEIAALLRRTFAAALGEIMPMATGIAREVAREAFDQAEQSDPANWWKTGQPNPLGDVNE